jgi:hypothetical protein
MRYEIIDKVAYVYRDNEDFPYLIQPHYPNGVIFSSDEEASVWAEQEIEFATDPTAPNPQLGPNEERIPRKILTEEHIRLLKIIENAGDNDSLKQESITRLFLLDEES